MQYPTVFELAGRLLMPGEGKHKATKASRPATEGITPKRVALEPDLVYSLGPSQLSYMRIAVSPTGIGGAQRDPTADAQGRKKVREVADAIQRGVPFPHAIVALDPDTRDQWIPDGGNRACATFLARLPILVVTRFLNEEERRRIFIDQTKARPINKQHFVCNGKGPLDLYVQDALTSTDHAWSQLVAFNSRGGRMSPGQMADAAGAYGCNVAASPYKRLDQSKFDPRAADELAGLLACFGSYEANPDAHRDKMRRAQTMAATYAVRRSGRRPQDAARWKTHMPSFRFGEVTHVREAKQLVNNLLAHWNKRLSPERKVWPYA